MKQYFFALSLVLSVFSSSVHAGGLFGNIFRGVGRELKGITHEVTSTVKETTQGVKGDIEEGTGIPISRIEARKRRARVGGLITKLAARVTDRVEFDTVVVYLWNALGQLEEGDDEKMAQVIEYFEGSLGDIKKEDVKKKSFMRDVRRLEAAVLNLSAHRGDLPETFDFAASFKLQPREDEEQGDEESGDDQDGRSDEYGDDDNASIAQEDDGYEGDGATADDDPVLARYTELQARYEGKLEGSGFFKLSVSGAGSGATFDIVDPQDGQVLAEGAESNKVHRIRGGIFHFVISVADARIYRFNVVILPRKLAQITFRSFGSVSLPSSVDEAFNLCEKSTGRIAYEGLSGGDEITVPVGKYFLTNSDEETVIDDITVKKGKNRRLSL